MIRRTRLFKQLLCNRFLLARFKLWNLRRIHALISIEWCALGDKHPANTSDLPTRLKYKRETITLSNMAFLIVGRSITGCSSLPFPLDSSGLPMKRMRLTLRSQNFPHWEGSSHGGSLSWGSESKKFIRPSVTSWHQHDLKMTSSWAHIFILFNSTFFLPYGTSKC